MSPTRPSSVEVAGFDVREFQAVGAGRRALRSEGDDALAFGREAVDRAAPHRRVQRFVAGRRALPIAEFEHPFGRALDGDKPVGAGAIEGRHEAVASIEGDLRQAWEVAPRRLGVDAGLDPQGDQRPLHRIAIDDPVRVRLAQRRIVAEHGGARDLAERGMGRRLGRDAVEKKRAARLIAGAGRGEHARGGQDRFGGHLVQGQRAGLVGADRRYRAERLDGGKASDDGVALGHPAHADRKRDRHHRRQALGNGGDRDANRGHERMFDLVAANQRGESADARRNSENDDRQPPGEGVHLAQERRSQGFDATDHGADAPKLGRSAGRDDQARALAARDQRPGIGDRSAIAQRSVSRDGLGRLVRRRRFSGQHRFFDPEAARADEPEVGGNAIARLSQDDVADDQAFDRNREPPAVAHDRRLAREHAANRVQRLFGAALLDEADCRVDDDYAEDDHGIDAVAEQEGDQRRSEQDINQEVVDLGEELRRERTPLAGRQAVGPARLEALRGLGGRQSLGRGAAALERGRGGFRVPGAFGGRGPILHRPPLRTDP